MGHFISVDWGTSNFRLKVLDIQSGKVLESHSNNHGIKKLYQKWQQVGGTKEDIFLGYLASQLEQLQTGLDPQCIIGISGMASSSIGIQELPYSRLPFEMNGKGLLVKSLTSRSLPYKVYLISGVCAEQDVMRGEETQLIGLFHQSNSLADGCLILPGTHSKHLFCEKGMVVSFQTHMTGEIFNLLSSSSILANSVAPQPWSSIFQAAFLAGIERSKSQHLLLHDLFTIRAKDLFKQQSKAENYYFLSGLLIGFELHSVQLFQSERIFLCAGNQLSILYEFALEAISLAAKTSVLSSEMVDQAAEKGQMAILKTYEYL